MLRGQSAAGSDCRRGATRTNPHSSHPQHDACEVDEGEVVGWQSVVAGGEATEVLELVEASFDAVSELVDDRIVGDGLLARAC